MTFVDKSSASPQVFAVRFASTRVARKDGAVFGQKVRTSEPEPSTEAPAPRGRG